MIGLYWCIIFQSHIRLSSYHLSYFVRLSWFIACTGQVCHNIIYNEAVNENNIENQKWCTTSIIIFCCNLQSIVNLELKCWDYNPRGALNFFFDGYVLHGLSKVGSREWIFS